MNKLDRIIVEPERVNGQPCIRDTRITVRRVLEALAAYPDRDEFRREYPELEDEDIRQALAYAAANLLDSITPSPGWMIKLLLDEGLPRSAATLLRAADVDTQYASELGIRPWRTRTFLISPFARGVSSRSMPTSTPCWRCDAPKSLPSCESASRECALKKR